MKLFYNSLKTLPRNARMIIFIQPLWSIPFFLYNSYLSLYMLDLGLTPKMVGLINSVSFLARTVLGFFAGNIVDKLGRKKSLVLFDALSWLIPILLWAIATNFWHFMIAGIINTLVVVNGIASSLFIVEDVDKERRLDSFNYLEVVMIVSGFFVPISGILFKKYAFVPTMRGVFVFAFICTCVFILLKQLYVKETSIGERIRSSLKKKKVSYYENFITAVKFTMNNKYLLLLLVVRIITSFNFVLYGLFYFPLLKNYFNYSETSISVIPFISSFVILIILVFFIPGIKDKPFYLLSGLFFSVLGGAAIVIAPKTFPFIFILLNVLLWAVSKSLINPVMNQEVANAIDDELRANVNGAQNIIMALAMFPAGILGGLLFEISPRLPFYGMLVLYILAFGIYFNYYKLSSRKGGIREQTS